MKKPEKNVKKVEEKKLKKKLEKKLTKSWWKVDEIIIIILRK